jgi:hypothetical protein
MGQHFVPLVDHQVPVGIMQGKNQDKKVQQNRK